MDITPEEIASLLQMLRAQRQDNQSVEAKECGGGLSKDVWESVSAFANTAGGLLLLGISERNGFAPVDAFDAQRVCDQFVDGMGDGNPAGSRISNPPHYDLALATVEGSTVLAIEVAEASPQTKPCYITARGIQNGSYKRVGDKDIRLSPTEIFEMQNAYLPSEADRELVAEATLEDLDPDIVEEALGRLSRENSRALRGAQTQAAKLGRLGIVDTQGGIRLAGLVAAGYYPQQFYPMLVVDVAAHPANEKAQGGPVRFLDRVVCEGPAGEIVEQAVVAILRNLRTTSVVRGSVRTDAPEIPEEALREAIANAVVHREYAPVFRGQVINVDIYPNRVEIANPGSLWGGKTLDNLDDGTSRCRNTTLMKLMRIVSGQGPGSGVRGMYVEGQGSGIAMMVQAMRARGLADPIFANLGDGFRVTLLRPGAAALASDPGTRPAERTYIANPDEAILAALSTKEPKGVRDIAEAIGMKVDTARVHLRKLVAEGKAAPTAPTTSRNRQYLRML